MATKLEKLAPHLTALAASIGQTIKADRNSRQYVLVPSFRPLTLMNNPQPCNAERQIQRILTAREQPSWGTPYERACRAIDDLRRAEYRPGHIIEWQRTSLDNAHLGYSFGEWDCEIRLVNFEPIRVRNASTRDGCLDTLAAICRAKLKNL